MMDEKDGASRTCVECARVAPAVNTGYTLISQAHGWRLTRRKAADGYVMEWRCADCSAKHRAAGPAAAPPSKAKAR